MLQAVFVDHAANELGHRAAFKWNDIIDIAPLIV